MESYASQTLHHVAGLIRRYTFYFALLCSDDRHHRTYNPKHVPVAALQFTTSPVIRSPDSSQTHPLLFPEFKTRPTSPEQPEQPSGNESVHSANRGVLPLARVIEHRTRFPIIDELRFLPPNVPNLLHATVLRVTRRQFRGSPGGGRPGDFFRRVGPNRV